MDIMARIQMTTGNPRQVLPATTAIQDIGMFGRLQMEMTIQGVERTGVRAVTERTTTRKRSESLGAITRITRLSSAHRHSDENVTSRKNEKPERQRKGE